MKYLIVAIALAACSRAPQRPDPEPSPPPVSERYQAAVARLDPFLDGGWIVSRRPDASAEHTGDSLIWSGIAMAALPCDGPGAAIETALSEAVHAKGGALERHPTLPSDASLDGALGLYLGVAERTARCHSQAWPAVIAEHAAFVREHEGKVNETGGSLEAALGVVLDQVGFQLGVGPRPTDGRQRTLEAEMASWAFVARASRSACFRIHLGWLALRTIEKAGGAVTAGGRDAFCAASAGTDLPVVDHWCGRGDVAGWIDAFQYDAWEYRHQRCPAWETPDGKNNHSPAIDYLIAIRDAYEVGP